MMLSIWMINPAIVELISSYIMEKVANLTDNTLIVTGYSYTKIPIT